MIQINPYGIKWSRIIITILLIALLIISSLLYSQCNKNDTVFDDYQKRNQQLKNEIVESNNAISLLKINVETLEKQKDSISKNLKIVVQEKIKYIETFKFLDIDGQQNYFTKNYNQLSNPLKFVKLDSLQAFNVITDIELGKIFKYKVGELNKIIAKDSAQIGDYKIMVLEFEKKQERYEAVLEDCENTLYEAQKQVNFRLLLGGGIGANKELNQGLYKANLGFQNKKGNVAFASYMKIGSVDYFLGEYNFSLFTTKEK